jgi:hypothetical protein
MRFAHPIAIAVIAVAAAGCTGNALPGVPTTPTSPARPTTPTPTPPVTSASVAITPPADVHAGSPASFAVSGTGADLRVSWGDGTSVEGGTNQVTGAISGNLVHVYVAAGRYILVATVTDGAGNTVTTAEIVICQ